MGLRIIAIDIQNIVVLLHLITHIIALVVIDAVDVVASNTGG